MSSHRDLLESQSFTDTSGCIRDEEGEAGRIDADQKKELSQYVRLYVISSSDVRVQPWKCSTKMIASHTNDLRHDFHLVRRESNRAKRWTTSTLPVCGPPG